MNTSRYTILRSRRTRRGITLVEMMVAMALSLGILLILTEAFKIALDFVRIANANGTMMNHLAGAGNMLDHDLSAEHFLPEPGKPNGGVKLSDQHAHRRNAAGAGWNRPRAGFVRIVSPQPTYEAYTDREGNTLSTATNHQLQFTSIFKDSGDAERFLGISPAGSTAMYKSPAGEVAWFLVPTGERTSAGAGSLPLHNLVRRYRLVSPSDDMRAALQQAVANDPGPTPTHHEVISVPNPGGPVNTLATVINAANRVPLAPLANARYGEDVVLTNVLSFEVLVWWDRNVTGLPGSTADPRPFLDVNGRTLNSEAPYDYLPGTGVFDTATAGTGTAAIFPAIRVRGLQITIRVCDPRVGIARQNTWRFAM